MTSSAPFLASGRFAFRGEIEGHALATQGHVNGKLRDHLTAPATAVLRHRVTCWFVMSMGLSWIECAQVVAVDAARRRFPRPPHTQSAHAAGPAPSYKCRMVRRQVPGQSMYVRRARRHALGGARKGKNSMVGNSPRRPTRQVAALGCRRRAGGA